MDNHRIIKLRLASGVRIPNWIKYLQGVEIGYEQVQGRRIRFIKFRRARFLHFGRGGCVWVSLPQFTETFSHFRPTLQILDGRGRMLDSNIFLCPRCFTLSGKLLNDPVPVNSLRVQGQLVCMNNDCSEYWERTW